MSGEPTGRKPGSRFFVSFLCSWADNSMDTTGETPQEYDSLQDATEAMISEVEGHGMTAYIYECRPVRKVVRGKVRVTDLK